MLNGRHAAKLVARSPWLFLITSSDEIWERTSKPSSVEVILWVWGADLIWPGGQALPTFSICCCGSSDPKLTSLKTTNIYCLMISGGSEIQEQLSCGSARVSVIWRSPSGSGGGVSVSELTHVYVGWLQFLVSGSYCKISYDMASSRVRDTREQERENDQGWSHCVFISWSWKWRAIISVAFYQTPLVQRGRWLCKGVNTRMGL